MKTVLVAYASRMGSTQEIAAAIGDQLVSRGFGVEVVAAVDAASARGFDAVLLGSAVYRGQWDKHAVDYLRREATELGPTSDLALPEWTFRSGCREWAHRPAPSRETAVPHHRSGRTYHLRWKPRPLARHRKTRALGDQ